MVEQNEPSSRQTRHQAFVIALPLATTAVTLTYVVELVSRAADPFNLVALPLLALAFSALTAAHLMQVLPLRWVEAGFFSVAVAVFVTKLGYTLLGPYGVGAQVSQLSQVYIWTPFIYVLAFLVGTARTGMHRAIAVYGGSLLIGLASVGGARAHPHLIEYYLSNALLLTLVYLVSTLRARLGSLQGDLDQMERLATQDFLTGVPNRRRLELQLQLDLEQTRRYGTPVSVILLDIDNFKRFNDTFGHERGDEVLKSVARAVHDELRTTDAFGRWGGEEFLVTAAHTRAPEAAHLAERLRQRVAGAVSVADQSVTASFGVAAHHANESLAELVGRADAALYRAKAAGKNRVEVARVGGLPPGLTLTKLQYPFQEVLAAPEPAEVAAVAAWLERQGLGPAPAGLRQRFADGFCGLARTLHPGAAAPWRVLLGKWYCWAFLHDDRCDATELGRHPGELEQLTARLLELFRGTPPSPADEPLAQALADLRTELAAGGGAVWLEQLSDALAEHFDSLLWEAHNRASGDTPSLSRYLEMRPVTAGLLLDDLFSFVDGVDPVIFRRERAQVASLSRLANEVVCWANDLLSLDKELRQGDVHNLVLVLQNSHGLSLAAAVAQAEDRHAQALARYLEAETASCRTRNPLGSAAICNCCGPECAASTTGRWPRVGTPDAPPSTRARCAPGEAVAQVTERLARQVGQRLEGVVRRGFFDGLGQRGVGENVTGEFVHAHAVVHGVGQQANHFGSGMSDDRRRQHSPGKSHRVDEHEAVVGAEKTACSRGRCLSGRRGTF